MDIERAAVGEMRPTEPSLSNHMSTHTHTLDAVPLKWSPLFPHTHTHTVYEGGGRRFEVSLQLRGLTPQVSP